MLLDLIRRTLRKQRTLRDIDIDIPASYAL